MSDVVSFAEVDGQHVEMLAARTLLTTSGPVGNVLGSDSGSADAQNNQRPTGGDGGQTGSTTGTVLTGIASNL